MSRSMGFAAAALLFVVVAFCADGAAAQTSNCAYGSPVPIPGVLTYWETDAFYNVKRAQFATAMATAALASNITHPVLIADCKTDQQVVAAVKWAYDCGYKVSVRSGGHSYAAYSSCRIGTKCMQISLSNLNRPNGDPLKPVCSVQRLCETDIPTAEAVAQAPVGTKPTFRVTFGVANKLIDIAPLLRDAGLFIPHGICGTVGVGGHFQSSSLGFNWGSFGLGLDHVESFRIVRANGVIETVTAESNPDLYWSVLGGSPGSWGVVLDYTFQAMRSKDYPDSTAYNYRWPYTRTNFIALYNVIRQLANEIGPEFMPILSVGPKLISLTADIALPLFIPGSVRIAHEIALTGFWSGKLGRLDFDRTIKRFLEAAPGGKVYSNPFDPEIYNGTTHVPLSVAGAAKQFLSTGGGFPPESLRYQIASKWTSEAYGPEYPEVLANEFDRRQDIPLLAQLWQGGADPTFPNFKPNQPQLYKNAYGQRGAVENYDDWILYASKGFAAGALALQTGCVPALNCTFVPPMYLLTAPSFEQLSDIAATRINELRNTISARWPNNFHNSPTGPQVMDSTFMTPDTTYINQEDLENQWMRFYPSKQWFLRLQRTKVDVDPCDLFSSIMTIPLTVAQRQRLANGNEPSLCPWVGTVFNTQSSSSVASSAGTSSALVAVTVIAVAAIMGLLAALRRERIARVKAVAAAEAAPVDVQMATTTPIDSVTGLPLVSACAETN